MNKSDPADRWMNRLDPDAAEWWKARCSSNPNRRLCSNIGRAQCKFSRNRKACVPRPCSGRSLQLCNGYCEFKNGSCTLKPGFISRNEQFPGDFKCQALSDRNRCQSKTCHWSRQGCQALRCHQRRTRESCEEPSARGRCTWGKTSTKAVKPRCLLTLGWKGPSSLPQEDPSHPLYGKTVKHLNEYVSDFKEKYARSLKKQKDDRKRDRKSRSQKGSKESRKRARIVRKEGRLIGRLADLYDLISEFQDKFPGIPLDELQERLLNPVENWTVPDERLVHKAFAPLWKESPKAVHIDRLSQNEVRQQLPDEHLVHDVHMRKKSPRQTIKNLEEHKKTVVPLSDLYDRHFPSEPGPRKREAAPRRRSLEDMQERLLHPGKKPAQESGLLWQGQPDKIRHKREGRKIDRLLDLYDKFVPSSMGHRGGGTVADETHGPASSSYLAKRASETLNQELL